MNEKKRNQAAVTPLIPVNEVTSSHSVESFHVIPTTGTGCS
jgi:hypothetical protein